MAGRMSIGSWEGDDASMSWHGDGVIRFVRLIGVCRLDVRHTSIPSFLLSNVGKGNAKDLVLFFAFDPSLRRQEMVALLDGSSDLATYFVFHFLGKRQKRGGSRTRSKSVIPTSLS